MTARLFLRAGLAFTFGYVGIASLLNPINWIGFLPVAFQQEGIVQGLSVFYAVMAVWLISGWRGKEAGGVAALFFLSVVAVNRGAFDIVFRDVGLFFAALALVVLNKIG